MPEVTSKGLTPRLPNSPQRQMQNAASGSSELGMQTDGAIDDLSKMS